MIAVVDDDESIRKALTRLLKSFGWRVEVFPSAEALLNFERLPDTACLILDVMMPGMNGLELQRWLMEAHRHIPIIFITAHEDDHARQRALALGAVAFLRKPFQEQVLIEAIRTAFDVGAERS